MNAPIFDRAMMLKLFALFALIGMVIAVLPIPRFETEIKGIGFDSPIQKDTATKVLVVENDW